MNDDKDRVQLVLDQLRYLTPKIERIEDQQEKLRESHNALKWKVMALSASVAYLAHHGIDIAKAFWP